MGNEVEGLKPCPFCPNGGKPWTWESHDPKADNRVVWCIACESCACEGPEASTKSEAAEQWNTRASTPSPLTAGTKIREIIETLCNSEFNTIDPNEAEVAISELMTVTPSPSEGEADASARKVVDEWDSDNGICLLGDHRDDLIARICVLLAGFKLAAAPSSSIQSTRDAALEEAAKIAESFHISNSYSGHWQNGAAMAATAIRDLIRSRQSTQSRRDHRI